MTHLRRGGLHTQTGSIRIKSLCTYSSHQAGKCCSSLFFAKPAQQFVIRVVEPCVPSLHLAPHRLPFRASATV